MSIDTAAPRTRRAIIAGAVGAVLGTIGVSARPPIARAGTDGDVVLDATNTAAGTTVINGNGDDPVFRVSNADADALRAISVNGVGLLGGSGDTSFPSPIEATTGVYGISVDGHGVYGASDSGVGVYAATNATSVAAIVGEGATYGIGIEGDAASGVGVHGHGDIGVRGSSFGEFLPAPAPPLGTGVQGWGGVGVHGSSFQGTGVFGKSGEVDVPFGNQVDRAITGVYGFCGHDTNATGVAGETTVGTGTHGIATSGVGVRGQSTSGIAVKADTTSGTAVKADTSSGTAIDADSVTGNGIRGSAGLDGVIGESKGNKTGVVGFSGSTQAPAGPANTGVYGEAAEDASARGVSGKTTIGHGIHGDATSGHAVHGAATSGHAIHGTAASGRGVHGGATTGVGVRAEATTGVALDVAGRAVFSRSGRASLPANAKYVDVTVPGGLSSSANVLATLQIKRAKVHVLAARPNHPSAGKVRIYVSDVASTTVSTPLAWFVLG